MAERHPSTADRIPGGREGCAKAAARPSDQAPAAPTYPVEPEERRAMFRRLLNLILADVLVARSGQPAVPAGLQPTLIRALHFLVQQGPRVLTVGDLAEGLNVSFGWASRIADDLAGAGLLERDRDEQDRRVVHLRLTPRARNISRKLMKKRAEPIVAALAEVDPEDRPMVSRFLQRLTAALDRHAAQVLAERGEPQAG